MLRGVNRIFTKFIFLPLSSFLGTAGFKKNSHKTGMNLIHKFFSKLINFIDDEGDVFVYCNWSDHRAIKPMSEK